jgi:predicted GNAT family acetyltransferase
MGVFALGELTEPPATPGHLRARAPADEELVRRWALAFHDESVLPAEQRTASVEHVAARQGTYFWDDGEPVCLVSHTATAAGVARVGPVYTPPERRRRGYAAAATAAVSRLLLDSGARVMLFTDLANPTSNGIYTRIGYRRVGDACEVRFVSS